MYGRPGFTTVLNRVSDAWQGDRANLLNHGSKVMQSIAQALGSQGIEASLSSPACNLQYFEMRLLLPVNILHLYDHTKFKIATKRGLK